MDLSKKTVSNGSVATKITVRTYNKSEIRNVSIANVTIPG